MYKLFYSPGACSLAPHIALEEIGLEYELSLVSVKKGETNSAQYLEINPKGRVPALYIEDELLTEAPAILIYLSRIHSQHNLLPKTDLELARCLEWFNYLATNVHAIGYGQLWRPARFSNDDACLPSITEKGRSNLVTAYAYIESLLNNKQWVVSNTYTCVDPYLFVFYRWGKLIGFNMEQFRNWTSHTELMLSRDTVQNALHQEGLIN